MAAPTQVLLSPMTPSHIGSCEFFQCRCPHHVSRSRSSRTHVSPRNARTSGHTPSVWPNRHNFSTASLPWSKKHSRRNSSFATSSLFDGGLLSASSEYLTENYIFGSLPGSPVGHSITMFDDKTRPQVTTSPWVEPSLGENNNCRKTDFLLSSLSSSYSSGYCSSYSSLQTNESVDTDRNRNTLMSIVSLSLDEGSVQANSEAKLLEDTLLNDIGKSDDYASEFNLTEVIDRERRFVATDTRGFTTCAGLPPSVVSNTESPEGVRTQGDSEPAKNNVRKFSDGRRSSKPIPTGRHSHDNGVDGVIGSPYKTFRPSMSCPSTTDVTRRRVKDDEGFIRRAACVCVNEDESKVLLISSKSDGDGWLCPGGGLEDDEEEEYAAVRETWEEGGIKGTVVRPLGTFQSIDVATHKKKRTAVFVLKVDGIFDDFPEAVLGRQREWFTKSDAISQLAQCKPNQIAYVKAL